MDPKEFVAEEPFNTKRDSCERDRLLGMLLNEEDVLFCSRSVVRMFTEEMEMFVHGWE